MLRIICLVFALLFFPSVSFCSNPINITIMTFNIENGGTQIDFNKVVEAVKKSQADVVGIQEAWGNTARLAKALGWKYYDLRQHIASRLPLLDAPDSEGRYIFIEVKPGKVIALANIHLPDEPYGPELVSKGHAVSEVELNEKIVRLPTITPTLAALSVLIKKQVPVFLTGDFNSPSDLDWTKATIHVVANHPYAVGWPVAKAVTANGMIDSFRAAHPNPLNTPGFTWPAKRPTVESYNPAKSDPIDRIDFIFAGNANVIHSNVLGESQVSPWPSDHRAVVSSFRINPATASPNLVPLANRLTSTGEPVIRIEQQKIKSNESLVITWKNAPGNGYDYIAISPQSSPSAWQDPIRLYTFAEVNGLVAYNANNVKGNWQAWNKVPEATWPLPPGKYDVKLMLDDSDKVLATTQIEVT